MIKVSENKYFLQEGVDFNFTEGWDIQCIENDQWDWIVASNNDVQFEFDDCGKKKFVYITLTKRKSWIKRFFEGLFGKGGR
jgi:hypothetical protein